MASISSNAPTFINPPVPGSVGQYADNLVVSVGSTLNLKWEGTSSTGSGLTLYLMRDDVNGDCAFQSMAYCDQIGGGSTLSNFQYAWNVSVDGIVVPKLPDVFYLRMNSAIGSTFNAHYFNITSSDKSTSQTSSSATRTFTNDGITGAPTLTNSISTSITTTTSSTNTGAAISTSPTASAQDNSDGLSVGAKAGIGVGAAIGVILIVLLAVIAFLLHKSSKSKRGPPQPISELGPGYENYSGNGAYNTNAGYKQGFVALPKAQPQNGFASELHSDTLRPPPGELDGSEPRRGYMH